MANIKMIVEALKLVDDRNIPFSHVFVGDGYAKEN